MESRKAILLVPGFIAVARSSGSHLDALGVPFSIGSRTWKEMDTGRWSTTYGDAWMGRA